MQHRVRRGTIHDRRTHSGCSGELALPGAPALLPQAAPHGAAISATIRRQAQDTPARRHRSGLRGEHHGGTDPLSRMDRRQRVRALLEPEGLSDCADGDERRVLWRHRNHVSVEPDRSRPSTRRHTLGEPTRRWQAVHEPPGRRPTGRYGLSAPRTGSPHISRRFTQMRRRILEAIELVLEEEFREVAQLSV